MTDRARDRVTGGCGLGATTKQGTYSIGDWKLKWKMSQLRIPAIFSSTQCNLTAEVS